MELPASIHVMNIDENNNEEVTSRPMNGSSSEHIEIVDLTEKSKNWADLFLQVQSEKQCDIQNKICQMTSFSPAREIEQYAEYIALYGSNSEKQYLKKVMNEEEQFSNCLSELWIGKRRSAFIDLAAGPFSWEPRWTYSQGSKTHDSLPSIPKQSSSTNLKKNPDQVVLNPSDHNLHAELEIIFRFSERFCATTEKRSENAKFCEDIDNSLKAIERGETATLSLLVGEQSEGANLDWPRDYFFARLAGIASSAINHLIVPPSPLFPSFYYEQITFSVYFVSSQVQQPVQNVNLTNFGFFSL